MLAAFMLVAAGSESGSATAMGGDIAAGAKAGVVIFKFAKGQSKIDAMNIPNEAKNIDMSNFKGDIEFKNVWFRYPTRKT